jgi:two-component system LytT family response regulator
VFQFIRRLPWLGCVALLLALVGLPERSAPEGAGELPLLPDQIDWVSAAGNYVELHGRGRTIVYRASLNSVEAQLARHGFLRVHRSTLVRRGAIARIRRIDLLLEDGTSLKLGKRYRSSLDGPEQDIRPFVPAE